ncbi:SAM-dependent methyltransferase [Ramlibacter montanisoli]|uniref:Class I SAM-dependent methyltransferase n=1 Tax=Ramlibacter montanisoli TaxID=2732512 RepID=A0A849K7N8_9BURK|nr:methyltransferase domain-containing protein [Ramlibacter montanisoli]NNU44368.1 class I SAM-dependent methyltransferase [Ramlibacter montanisoli]
MKRVLLAWLLGAALAAQAQVVDEVPFITSPDNVTLEMLRLANVGPGDHVIDLGSGDGRIVILAAKRFGATGLGVEIDPQLVERSLRSARDAGVAERVQFRVQDLFETDLSRASVITMYLLPEFNLKLRPLILGLKPGTRIVSHDWDMGDWKPDVSSILPVPDKKVGLEKFSRVHLWIVPAKVDGLWCASSPPAAGSLQLTQHYQEVVARSGMPHRRGAWRGRCCPWNRAPVRRASCA